MHRAATEAAHQTDSMKMFLMGVDGGKPADGGIGVQPEWFYKGDGAALIAPGAPLPSPDFALDAGEGPEIAGLYLIAGGRKSGVEGKIVEVGLVSGGRGYLKKKN